MSLGPNTAATEPLGGPAHTLSSGTQSTEPGDQAAPQGSDHPRSTTFPHSHPRWQPG